MSYNFYNPTTTNNLAKFQGTLAGIQAGNAYYGGVATAPTSIFNQAGYYALQDNDTGMVSIKKLANDSIYTNKWYDQVTGNTFDFSGTQSTSNDTTQSTDNNTSTDNTTTDNSATSGDGTTNNPSTSTDTTGNTTDNATDSTTDSSSDSPIEYPFSYPSTQTIDTKEDDTTVDSDNKTTVDTDNSKELTAQDLQDLVDAGIYDNLGEAYFGSTEDGYTMSDEEQAKLGLYSEDSENMIKTLMDKYDISRDEAIEKLGDKLDATWDDKEEYATLYQNFINNGFSEEEAEQYLKDLGYEKPEEMETIDLSKYKTEDIEKVKAYMSSTGCTLEEAIKATGVKEDTPGVLTQAFNAVGSFFGGIGKAIADGWNSFWDWLI